MLSVKKILICWASFLLFCFSCISCFWCFILGKIWVIFCLFWSLSELLTIFLDFYTETTKCLLDFATCNQGFSLPAEWHLYSLCFYLMVIDLHQMLRSRAYQLLADLMEQVLPSWECKLNLLIFSMLCNHFILYWFNTEVELWGKKTALAILLT